MAIKYEVLNKDGALVKEIDLCEEVFGVEYNESVVFDAIMVARSNSRQATAKVKTRFEIRGGGRKPFRQKGTGRARQGTSRAPHMVGGGAVFGPTGNQNFKIKQNKKEARLALKSVLTEKVTEKNLIIVDSYSIEAPKTKEFVSLLKNVKAGKKVLAVMDIEDVATIYSAANVENVELVTADGINVYDIVNADSLLISEPVLAKIMEDVK